MGAGIVTRCHALVTGETLTQPQIQNDPEGGIPSGSLEVWEV